MKNLIFFLKYFLPYLNTFHDFCSLNYNLITINEVYAIGPAISILMEGYIEKDKLISLRGTLVPATTPLLGPAMIDHGRASENLSM